MSPNSFSGFPRETLDYLRDLDANNSKEWFDDHSQRYDAFWKTPALDLIAALVEPMKSLAPGLKAEARINGSLRRINRDVRFAKDKTPYNARLHLIFWAGNHPNRSPAIHLVLSPQGVGYGAGVFGLDPAALAALRARIIDPGDRSVLLAALHRAASAGCTFDAPDLKKLPRGYAADGDWEHLLRRKALVVRTMETPSAPAWLFNSDCADNVMALTHSLMPLIRWLTP